MVTEEENGPSQRYIAYSVDADGKTLSERPLSPSDSERFVRGLADADTFTYIVLSEDGYRIRRVSYKTGDFSESEPFGSSDTRILDFRSDAAGRLYVLYPDQILPFDGDLTEKPAVVHSDTLYSLAADENGAVWVCGVFVDPTEIASLNTKAIAPVVWDSGTLGEPRYIFEGAKSVCFGAGYDLYFETDEGIWGLNFGKSAHDFSYEIVMSYRNSGVSAARNQMPRPMRIPANAPMASFFIAPVMKL